MLEADCGKLLASGGEKGATILWNVETGEEVHHWSETRSSVRSVAFLKQGQQLISAKDDGRIVIHEVRRGKTMVTAVIPGDNIGRFAVSPDESRLALAQSGGARGAAGNTSLITVAQHGLGDRLQVELQNLPAANERRESNA